MLKFYDVNPNYINFLKQLDTKVPDISYDTNNKFVCGTVLNIKGTEYFVPVSHNTTLYRTSLGIYDHNTVIATLRFSFMFPATDSVLTEKNFNDIRKVDAPYADLLSKEWLYCIHNEKKIQSKALSVYKMGTNEHHAMFKNCCNFKLLEEKYKEYNKENISPDINESMSVREKISKLNEENSHSETNTQQDREIDI